MYRNTFETPWGKVQNLLGMKFTTDVTLLFLSAVNSIYLFFCVTGVDYDINWINEYYVRDTVACTIKMNFKETFMGKDSFGKCFCCEWTAVKE